MWSFSVKRLIMIATLCSLAQQVVAKPYPIEATMIKPEMQANGYQVENLLEDNVSSTLVCTNGNKVKIYNKKDIYVPSESFWSAKALIRYSIVGDMVAKVIESDSVFVGNNTNWPIVVGAEVAKEGIIKYSEKHQIEEEKKQRALNATAGVSTGSSIANLAIVAGASNPIGAFIGIVGGIIVYNQATKQYELEKQNTGKVKVLTFIDHPTNIDKAYACE